jgi:predicted nucleic acid-binding Zn ribbon protein
MANKKSKNKPVKSSEAREAARRTRTLQIIFVAFSIILILSMVLSLASK